MIHNKIGHNSNMFFYISYYPTSDSTNITLLQLFIINKIKHNIIINLTYELNCLFEINNLFNILYILVFIIYY